MLATSITLDPNPHPALSYAGLRAEALELLGRLCGDQWSDFNSHDPGITILEQLCFALTELAYRSQWSIEDLLASAGPDWQPAAREILGGDPVTRDDLIAVVRALGCEAVRVETLDQPDLPLYFRPSTSASTLPEGDQSNGFPPVAGDLELEPDLASGFAASPQSAVVPRGVWRVAAQLGALAHGSGPLTLLPIAQRLHGARLLGRDFAFEVLNPFAVVVRAELEVDPAQVTLDMMLRLRTCLDQAIRRAGADDNSRGLRSSALIQVLLALPEVRQVTSFALASSPSGPWQPWHLPLLGGGARLHPASSLSLFHRGVRPAEPNGESRQAAASSDLAEPAPLGLPTSETTTSGLAKSDLAKSDLAKSDSSAAAAVSPGRRRTLTGNRSLALDLPAVYGVGQAGLPAGASPERQQQARQLRNYLLFFDQLLANGQAQLAQAIPLLSPVEADVSIGTAAHRQALLAHLLQRFGEELNLGGQPQAGPQTLLQARSDFLRRIVPLSGGRGSGPDLLAAAPGQLREDDQGAFAERLRRKLGLPLAADGSPPLLVIEHLLLRPLSDDSSQRVQGGEDPIPFLADVARPDPWSARVSVVINAAMLPQWPADAPADACDRWLVNVVRQELPAHLVAELHLLADADASPGQGQGQGPWSAMVTAWRGFRDQLRAQRRAGLGTGADVGDLGKCLLSLRLRDRRDRLISLLRIGLPWPLRGIPFKEEQVMVATGNSAAIELLYSQPGVGYQLVEVASGAAVGEAAEGGDGPLTLTTPPISRDLILRVQASVLPPSPVATANGRLRSTLLVGEVVVVEGVDASLPLRLLDGNGNPLPLLLANGAARLAIFGQEVHVEVGASQEGVVYEVIDNAQRLLDPKEQKPLSAAVTGTSDPIVLTLSSRVGEDLDLTVRASLKRKRGQALSEQQKVLDAVLPLRVRANPAVPLRLEAPVMAPNAPAVVVIGDPAGAGESGSQSSVRYQLWARPLADEDWRFESPAAAAEITVIGESLAGFSDQKVGAAGNGAVLNLEQSVSGEGMVVAALARKEHSRDAFHLGTNETHPSELPLRQAVVVFTQPERQRLLLLRREPEGPHLWSLWGGQPGVAYTLGVMPADDDAAKPPVVPIPERQEAVGGLRGIGRLRVGRDLLVSSPDGLPLARFAQDPTSLAPLPITARYLRSGVQVVLERPPVLVWVEPPAVGRGESAEVLIAGLAADKTGRLLRGETLLAEGRADGEGRLRLATGPLPGATTLQLDVGVRCAVAIAQGVNTDPVVRVLDFRALQEGAPAHLLDWGADAVVELAESQPDVSYTLINAADRDKPPEQQQSLCDPVPGTGGPLRLVCARLEEDVDLLVLGTRLLDRAGLQRVSGILGTVLPLRVRANPALPIALVEPVVDLAASTLVWVGDEAVPSQFSATYKAWTWPIGPEDWQWQEPASAAGSPRMPALPPAAGPAEAGWSGRGQPKKGTGGDGKRGVEGRLQLSLGQAGSDAVVAVVASKPHSPFPLGSQDATSVSSQVLLNALVVQLTRPDPEQRLALVAESGGWRLVGGEPGSFHAFLRQRDRAPLATAVYVHQRTREDPPNDWGLERLRVNLDLAVAGDGGPGLAPGPTVPQLRQAMVEVRRAFSGTSSRLQRGPLLVTQEPSPPESDDTATLVVWGLVEGERASLRQGGAAVGEPARLGTGPVAVGTELTLAIGPEGAANPWRVPVRVLAPANLAP